MVNPWQQKFSESWPAEEWHRERLLVAVSAGADSVALLRLILESGCDQKRLIVGTFDHQLRPDSKNDAAFVQELCRSLSVDCQVGSATVKSLAEQSGDGIESAAREARYDWMRATAKENGARYVVTAHTTNDQVETILHRIVRGTGVTGLSGMPRVRLLSPEVTLVRPLLNFEQQELRDYLNSLGQSWREDPTNESLDFTRNKIRHKLLPLLRQEYNSDVNHAILRLGKLAGTAQAVIDEQVDTWFTKSVQIDRANQSATLRPDQLQSCNEYLLRELCVRIWKELNWSRQQMTMTHWEELANLIYHPSATTQQDFPDNIRATKTAAGVILQRLR